MTRHGVPAGFLSDNGPRFAAAIFRKFCTNIGVREIYSTPYYLQGNSVVESYMRTLKKGLASLVSEDGRNWGLFVSAVALAHNTTPHTSPGYSTFFMMHRREAMLSV